MFSFFRLTERHESGIILTLLFRTYSPSNQQCLTLNKEGGGKPEMWICRYPGKQTIAAGSQTLTPASQPSHSVFQRETRGHTVRQQRWKQTRLRQLRAWWEAAAESQRSSGVNPLYGSFVCHTGWLAGALSRIDSFLASILLTGPCSLPCGCCNDRVDFTFINIKS